MSEGGYEFPGGHPVENAILDFVRNRTKELTKANNTNHHKSTKNTDLKLLRVKEANNPGVGIKVKNADGTMHYELIQLAEEDYQPDKKKAVATKRKTTAATSSTNKSSAQDGKSKPAGKPKRRPRAKCDVLGCTKTSRTAGKCNSHGKRCDHPGCKAAVHTEGKCKTHGPRCSEKGCNLAVHQGGKCKKHHQQVR
jgi:hypothetical protein